MPRTERPPFTPPLKRPELLEVLNVFESRTMGSLARQIKNDKWQVEANVRQHKRRWRSKDDERQKAVLSACRRRFPEKLEIPKDFFRAEKPPI